MVKLPVGSANRFQKGHISVVKHLFHFISAIMKVQPGQGKDFLKDGRGKKQKPTKIRERKERNAVQAESAATEIQWVVRDMTKELQLEVLSQR